jgi:hypothetical protein
LRLSLFSTPAGASFAGSTLACEALAAAAVSLAAVVSPGFATRGAGVSTGFAAVSTGFAARRSVLVGFVSLFVSLALGAGALVTGSLGFASSAAALLAFAADSSLLTPAGGEPELDATPTDAVVGAGGEDGMAGGGEAFAAEAVVAGEPAGAPLSRGSGTAALPAPGGFT